MLTYRAEMSVRVSQTLKTNWKLDIARTNNVLNLKVCELCRETKLLNDTSVLSRSQLWVIFGFGTSHHHLARCKNQSRRLWVTNSHDNSSKTLMIKTKKNIKALALDKLGREYINNRLESTPLKVDPYLTWICTFGLYSALRACRAMVFRSKRQSKLTVATIFLKWEND